MKNKKYIGVVVFVFLNFLSFSQFEFYNNGAQVLIQPGALVKVQGTATNLGNLENDGLFDIDNNHEILLTGVSSGSGEYRVKEDWINNNLFIRGISHHFSYRLFLCFPPSTRPNRWRTCRNHVEDPTRKGLPNLMRRKVNEKKSPLERVSHVFFFS